MPLTYAEFNSHTFARKALRRLRPRIGDEGRVRVMDTLSHHTMPLRLTAAGIGILIGGASLALLMAAAIGVAVLVGLPVAANPVTITLAMGLAFVLGCLAGGLSFASDDGALAKELRRWQREGKPVVVVEHERGHEETLRHVGAVRTYKVD